LRLITDLEHLGRPSAALSLLEKVALSPASSVASDSVSLAMPLDDREALQKKLIKLSKPPLRWRVPTFEPLRQCPSVEIRGTLVSSAVGRKNLYATGDELREQCTVEQLALAHYVEQHGFEGVHNEGSWLRQLFTLLMWDILFADVNDVFQTPYQRQPLDLESEYFYVARREAIDARLTAVRAMSCTELCQQLETQWNEQQCVSALALYWESDDSSRTASLANLKSVASGLGGR
jgi:Fanconi-associated nuclease 1